MPGIDIAHAPDWTFRLRRMHALSMDVAVGKALRDERYRGAVHSIFARVVNIVCQAGELFTIASRDLDDAPNTLIADTAGFALSGIDCGDRVDTIDGRITIGRQVEIQVDRAVGWNALLPRYCANETRLRRNLATVRSYCGRRGIVGLAMANRTTSALSLEMMTTLERHAARLCAALSRGELKAARAHGRAMVGLGPGLTPSGDDFLVGLFAVLHVRASPCHEFKCLCVKILADVDRQTNSISAAALKAAASGRVRESIISLIRELMGGSHDRVVAALSLVLSIGSTSGADLVIGILSGFDAHMRRAALERDAVSTHPAPAYRSCAWTT